MAARKEALNQQFLFQIGSIKRENKKVLSFGQVLFLFQIGSIKRGYGWTSGC